MRHTTASSCADCLAYGVLSGRLCAACYAFRSRYPAGCCAACEREIAVKKGYCRLCWCQASLQARGLHLVLPPVLAQICHHQLFFAGMKTNGRHNPPRHRQDAPPGAPARGAGLPARRWQAQLALFAAGRDFTRFDRRAHAGLASPWLAHARHAAAQLAEARGWTPKVRRVVDRALVVLLSEYADGEMIRYSDIYPVMRARDLSIQRTADVLQQLGIFHDDRRQAFEGWLAAKLQDLAPGIAREAASWARALRDGSARRQARSENTVRRYLNTTRPALAHWSLTCQHLREITADDVRAVLASQPAAQQTQTLIALRSLFGYAKRQGIIFRNPAARLTSPGSRINMIILPLSSQQIAPALATTASPASRLILALAAVHAARTSAIRTLQLGDLDLGNRRITIASRTRPLDDLTHALLHDWLTSRQARWPRTANPHLLINQRTAMETGPVSAGWISEALPAGTLTVEQLRIDRHLDEALARGPDPLHLAVVFGLSPKAAIRYSNAARQILTSQAETTPGSGGPDGQPDTRAATERQ
jgi:integrase